MLNDYPPARFDPKQLVTGGTPVLVEQAQQAVQGQGTTGGKQDVINI